MNHYKIKKEFDFKSSNRNFLQNRTKLMINVTMTINRMTPTMIIRVWTDSLSPEIYAIYYYKN
ncbi:hypothetical protein DERF_003297 [Dermatophagoides farinae]|uniref:Uncharacterized protein n=1 Tax=Dermatophagoides farinae TaxID=6954 RepID=A0A922IDA3_DERFA|nr:hypothetical protein DERF_003297 [Dermatophagoides farinae]